MFQLLHSSLPATFPPLRSLNTIPNNLPQQLTSFVGREREIQEVIQLLKTSRLLTLTGAGGCGKTRLALQVGAEVLENYPDGVWFIDLAPVNDPSLIPQTVAAVLKLKEEPGRPLTETLLNFLKYKSALLIFDNYEHLITARDLLAGLIQQSNPSLRFLATSREILSIVGEVIWRVPSLSIPTVNTSPLPESLTQFEAVRLFIERATLARPSFSVNRENAPAIAQICQRLDGIPLALELAAARVRVLSVEQINQRLNERFRLLTGGSRILLPRQQTLRALIDWGYNLLSDIEQRLFRRLTVFVGGWTLEAAETICAGDGIESFEILDLLSALVDKSMVVLEERPNEGVRYRLLETLRQYGQDKLTPAERLVLEQHYRSFFSDLAAAAEPYLQTPDAKFWWAQLEAELNNLRAVLVSYETSENAEAEVSLVLNLLKFWIGRGYWAEGQHWLESVLQRDRVKTPDSRALVLSELGMMALRQGDFVVARSLYETSLALYQQLNQPNGTADQLFNLGTVALCQGDYTIAQVFYAQSLDIQRSLSNLPGVGKLLFTLGVIADNQGDYTTAQALYQESHNLWQELGDRYLVAYALNGLGNLAEKQGNYEDAQSYYDHCWAIRQELGDRQSLAYSLLSFGSLAGKQGDYAKAQSFYEQSLAIQRELGDKLGMTYSLRGYGLVAEQWGDLQQARSLYQEGLSHCCELQEKLNTAFCLEGLARVAAAQHQYKSAAQWLAAAAELRITTGCPIPPLEQRHTEQAIEATKTALGAADFAQEWSNGRTTDLVTILQSAIA
ncbi:MAG: tetratricopeptide repeat protein [Leptolyngbyaceae cyanobacterium SL_7_1]|nr:tetratricopeptide repeat protein [Leptolyngbyaceae cyanobacterium SL_7_1]